MEKPKILKMGYGYLLPVEGETEDVEEIQYYYDGINYPPEKHIDIFKEVCTVINLKPRDYRVCIYKHVPDGTFEGIFREEWESSVSLTLDAAGNITRPPGFPSGKPNGVGFFEIPDDAFDELDANLGNR